MVPYISPPDIKHYLLGGCFHENIRCCVLIDRLTADCTPMAETSHLTMEMEMVIMGRGKHRIEGLGWSPYHHLILTKTGRAED